jgi:large subunit ribosomal protein L20
VRAAGPEAGRGGENELGGALQEPAKRDISRERDNRIMPRVKNSVATKKRRKKILKLAQGARGGRSKLFKSAKETIRRGLRYAFRDRRALKREYRQLWIARINAAVRANGLSYSEFMHAMKHSGLEIDRKVLADIALNDSAAFTAIVNKVRGGLSQVS